MTSEEIIGRHAARFGEPIPEDIARAIDEGRRFRAQIFRDTVYAAAAWLGRALGGNPTALAPPDLTAKPTHG